MPRKGSGRYGAKTRNEKGYVRLMTKPHRGKYEHRVVMASLCKEFCFYPLGPDGIPEGFTVEHQDHSRTHNCYQNLILLEEIIHNFLSSHSRLVRDNAFKRPDGTIDWNAVVMREQLQEVPF